MQIDVSYHGGHNRVVTENFWLGWVSYSLFPTGKIKPVPTHKKKYLLWEKVAQNATLILFFGGWVGLGLGGSSVS